MNLLDFEIKAHSKEWKVTFKSDSSSSNLLSHLLLKNEQANYKIKELFSLKNNSFIYLLKIFSPYAHQYNEFPDYNRRILYDFHPLFVYTAIDIPFPLHHDL